MKFKRTVSALLFIIFLCILTACTPEEPEVTTETEAVETEPPAPAELILADNGATDFKVIRSEDAEGYYFDTAIAVNQKLRSEISPDFKISEDWISPLEPSPEKDHEILLFSTNRAESAAAMAELTFEGYIIRVTDCKVVVVGSSPASCNEALYCLFDTIIPENTKDGRVALPIGLEVKKEFESSPLDIGEALKAGKTLCADFEVLFNYPKQDGFTAAQGSATDGEYAYVIMKDSSGTREVDRVVKIDMATWEVVLESETMPLDHANDMTYDPVKKQLVVTNMYDNLISIINPEDLTLIEQKKLSHGTYGTGYIEATNQYAFLGYGSVGGLVITDADFGVIRSSPLASAPNYIGQGMDADAKYAYVPLSPGTGKSDNIIQIYDIATGEYLGIATLETTMESESIFHYGNDYYIHFNNSGSKIASLEFYMRFE